MEVSRKTYIFFDLMDFNLLQAKMRQKFSYRKDIETRNKPKRKEKKNQNLQSHKNK